MRWVKSIPVMLTLLLVQFVMSYSQADQPGGAENWIAEEHGCKAYDPHPVAGQSIKWSGKCKGGFLEGPGRLQWYQGGAEIVRDDGVFLNGREQQGLSHTSNYERYCDVPIGEQSKLTCIVALKGWRRSGEFASYDVNGKGVEIHENGVSYSGDFVAGNPAGEGVYIYPGEAIYEGQIGVSRGIGTLIFPDGGRYYGQFTFAEHGTFDGYGITYDAQDRITGEGKFSDGTLLSKEPALSHLPSEPHHLPYSVQASALAVQVRDALVAKDFVSVLFLIDQYAALPGMSMPPALQFLQAKIAAEVHLPVLAKSAVEKYLTIVNREDAHYSEAISLLVKVKDAKLMVSP